MKTVIYSALIITLPILCLAEYDEAAFAQLIRNGAIAKYVYRVVDDDGAPVSNATAHVRFSSYARPQDNADWRIDTDTNGIFVAEHRLNEKFTVGIGKAGYYRTYDKINYYGMSAEERLSKVKDGKWQPYGEMRTVVLKKIKNPIKMVVPPSRINEAISLGEWHEYDLVAREWMPPYGNGKQTDVLIRLGLEAKNDISDFRATMDLCFTNSPYSGVYRMQKEQFSEMKSCYVADTNAVYETMVSNLYEKRPHKKTIDTRLTEDSYFVFRIRTTVDASGKLVSAHYGKILGPWEFFGTMRTGTVYFNPTPNDTNLEDAETARLSRLGYKQSIEFGRRRKAGGK